MKKWLLHIIILILSLPLLLIGCTILDEETPIGGESGKSYLEVNVEDLLTRGDADEIIPTVKSVRLLVFGENGEFLENRNVAISLSSTSIPLVLPSNVYGKEIYVYAVLNEEGSYCNTLESGVALSAELAKFTSTYGNRTDFLNLMNQPLKFDPKNADASAEKIFLMYAKNENVLVDSKATQDNPFLVNLSETEDVPRSMAKITIESINGEADADAAKVFVTDVRIINVPKNYSLSGKDAGTATEFYEIDNIGKYDRVWDGLITTTYAGSLVETVKISDRFYLMTEKGDKNSNWYFPQILSTPVLAYSFDSGKKAELSLIKKGKKLDLKNLTDYLEDADGTYIEDLTIESKKISYSDDKEWYIPFNKGIYIPENIRREKDYATSISLTLVIADPKLDVNDDLIANEVEWAETKFTGGKNSVSIPYKYSPTDNDAKAFFENSNLNINYCEKNNLDAVNQAIKAYTDYYQFIDNFKRISTGYFSNLSFSGKPGIINSTGITAEWKPTNVIMNFTIPVNNQNVGGDYSIKRNNHYQVSLKVTKATYDEIMKSGRAATDTQSRALSADQCPLEVSVKVSPLQ